MNSGVLCAGNTDQGVGMLGQGAGNSDQGAGMLGQGAGNIDQGAGILGQDAGSLDQGAGNVDQGLLPYKSSFFYTVRRFSNRKGLRTVCTNGVLLWGSVTTLYGDMGIAVQDYRGMHHGHSNKFLLLR